ncbi:hypothetical protein RvY_08574-2 [Ramazzottius varieornatus]|uniref:Protein kinase domain-containing protein n=1 Tax=Ramazzottius varieornatus TaxID=947166 RepID=A0A1D1VED9_RAMVA|nr:hypothetical protein RvY_08574-2 [Ramazzottius varieornatus]
MTVPEKAIRHFFQQLGNCLQVLHSEGIYHRDLMPANIFLHSLAVQSMITRDTDYRDTVLKLGDFGFSKELITGHWSITMRGTLTFLAPEVLDNKKIWDASTKPYEDFTTGIFGSEQMQLLHNMHAQIEQRAASLSPNTGSEDLRNFLRGLLQRDFTKRMTFPAFRAHQFLTSTVPDFGKEPDQLPSGQENSGNPDEQKIPARALSKYRHSYYDYQTVVRIYSGARKNESKIPDRWDAFGHTETYKVRQAFRQWVKVFHGTILCEGAGEWTKENSKEPREAFLEPFQRYLAHLCKYDMVDKEHMAKALLEQHDLSQSEKDNILGTITNYT